MAEYEVTDNQTGKTITFEWHEADSPTDADIEEVFAQARGGSGQALEAQPVSPQAAQEVPGYVKAIETAYPMAGMMIGGIGGGALGGPMGAVGDAAAGAASFAALAEGTKALLGYGAETPVQAAAELGQTMTREAAAGAAGEVAGAGVGKVLGFAAQKAATQAQKLKKWLVSEYQNLDDMLDSAVQSLGSAAAKGDVSARRALGTRINEVKDFLSNRLEASGERYGSAVALGKAYADPEKIAAMNEKITQDIAAKTVPRMEQRGAIGKATKEYAKGGEEGEEAALSAIAGLPAKKQLRIEKLIDEAADDDAVLDALKKMDETYEREINRIIAAGTEKYLPETPAIGARNTGEAILDRLRDFGRLQSLSREEARTARYLAKKMGDLRKKPVTSNEDFIHTMKVMRKDAFEDRLDYKTFDSVRDAMYKDMSDSSKYLTGDLGEAMRVAVADYAATAKVKDAFVNTLGGKILATNASPEAIGKKLFTTDPSVIEDFLKVAKDSAPPSMLRDIKTAYARSILDAAAFTTERGRVVGVNPSLFREFMRNPDNAAKAKAVLGDDIKAFEQAMTDADTLAAKATISYPGAREGVLGRYLAGAADMQRPDILRALGRIWNTITFKEMKARLLTTEHGRETLRTLVGPSDPGRFRKAAERFSKITGYAAYPDSLDKEEE